MKKTAWTLRTNDRSPYTHQPHFSSIMTPCYTFSKERETDIGNYVWVCCCSSSGRSAKVVLLLSHSISCAFVFSCFHSVSCHTPLERCTSHPLLTSSHPSARPPQAQAVSSLSALVPDRCCSTRPVASVQCARASSRRFVPCRQRQ